MKKNILFCFVFVVIALTSCNVPEKVTEEMQRTFAASTVQAKANEIASLTPPTPTSTNTPVPTDTPVSTDTPTPTITPSNAFFTSLRKLSLER